MAYTDATRGYSWLGVYYPPAPATAVYCDPCAYAGAVPFVVRMPEGDIETMGVADEIRSALDGYRYRQKHPWAWEPKGWNKKTDETPCARCGNNAASGLAWYDREIAE